MAVGVDNVPPAPASKKLTDIPEIALPLASLILTFRGPGNSEATGSFCKFPDEIENEAALPTVAVTKKVAVAYPGLDAVIVELPVEPTGYRTVVVPELSVIAVELENEPAFPACA